MSVPELSTEQCKTSFAQADKSRDGKCSVMELSQYLAKTFNFPPKDAIKMFSECDKDGNMVISCEEFIEVMKKARTKRFEMLFKECDKDGSGKISMDEFLKFSSKGPIKDLPKLKQLFAELDKDKSGQLTKDEFLRMSLKY